MEELHIVTFNLPCFNSGGRLRFAKPDKFDITVQSLQCRRLHFAKPDKLDITVQCRLAGYCPKRNFRTDSNDIREQDCSGISAPASSLEDGRIFFGEEVLLQIADFENRFQDNVDRQSTTIAGPNLSTVTLLLTVIYWLAIGIAIVFLVPRPPLQSHPRCGLTTGGQVCAALHRLFLNLKMIFSRTSVGGNVRLPHADPLPQPSIPTQILRITTQILCMTTRKTLPTTNLHLDHGRFHVSLGFGHYD